MRLSLILLLLVVVSGCRTYGGEYGTEPALLEKIAEANRLFAEDLERARGDLVALERTAASEAMLESYVAPYAAVVEVHEAVLEANLGLAAEAAEDDGDYRLLNRTYGAIISDQRIVKDRYEEVLSAMARTVARDTTSQAPVPPTSRFQVAPAFYERLASGHTRQALAGILAMARGEALPAAPPDTAAVN